MTGHETATRQEWLAARFGLLKVERELARRSNALARRGRDQGVHRNPVTLVTPARRSLRPKNPLGSLTAGNGQNRSGG